MAIINAFDPLVGQSPAFFATLRSLAEAADEAGSEGHDGGHRP
jgi:hypothetical protein